MADDGFSSDDLLKQAKDDLGLDDDDSTPVAPVPTPDIDEIAAQLQASRAESETAGARTSVDSGSDIKDWLSGHMGDPDPAPEPAPRRSASDIAAELRTDAAPSAAPSRPSDFINAPVDSPAVPPAPSHSPAPIPGPTPFGTPADYRQPGAGGSAPPRMPDRADAPTLPPLPSEPAPKESKRRLGVGTLIRLGIAGVVGATVLAGVLDSSTPVQDIGTGDCIKTIDEQATEIDSLDTVPCTEEHEFEVFGVPTFDLAAYPISEDVLFDAADQMCYDRFASYVGIEYEDSALFFSTLIPTETAWDQGDRSATCLLFAVDAGNSIFPLTSSSRNSGR